MSEEIIGLIGAIILVFSFAGQYTALKSKKNVYYLMNFVGAVILSFYSFIINSIPFAVVEICWAASALWYLKSLKTALD